MSRSIGESGAGEHSVGLKSGTARKIVPFGEPLLLIFRPNVPLLLSFASFPVGLGFGIFTWSRMRRPGRGELPWDERNRKFRFFVARP